MILHFFGGMNLAGGYFFIDDVSIKEAKKEAPTFPNVFTPNNDNVNDVWHCNFINYEAVNCLIYNRWGNIVFHSNEKNIQWSGQSIYGNECTEGVYYYVIETEEELFKGYIQLIR